MEKHVPTDGELIVQLAREAERTKIALENALKTCEELKAEITRLKLQSAEK